MREGQAEQAGASFAVCPGCGKPVDPLRAGHVAILRGQFFYFCDHACKVEHLQSVADGAVLSDDVATAEPPKVEGATEDPGSAVGSQTSGPSPLATKSESLSPSPDDARPRHDEVEDQEDNEESEENEDSPSAGADGANQVEPARVPSAPPLASPAVGARPVPRRRAGAGAAVSPRAIHTVALVGLGAGALAWALALAGPSAAAVRLPLACLAMGALLFKLAIDERDPSNAHPMISVVPAGGALVAAIYAQMADDPRALPLISFAGLAAASVLGADVLLARARRAMREARERIARGLDLNARVVRGEDALPISAALVKPGEQVVVEAGEVVGVDGQVVAGEAQVIPWLDAPLELTKREGDAVVAGARLVSGRLRLIVTWAAHERAWTKLALSPILRVDVAAPLARGARAIAERGAGVGALLVAVAVYVNNGGLLEVLASACAAALACGAAGVAAVVALCHAHAHMTALGRGIVFKDAEGFDRAGRTDVAVVCSRGTVLMGEPEIVALEALSASESDGAAPKARVTDGRLVALAAGAETASTHPFAAAILRAARARGERPENVRNATGYDGLGVTALASSGDRLVVGSRALLLQEKVSVAMADTRVSELEAQGRSVLLVALAGKLVGLLALQDGLRPGARAAVQRLLDARIEPVLLSGEARETCETIGRALDIDHIRPEVLPADRGAEVRALGEGGHVVAVLGHPAADDGALGAADVSVAMGSAGATPGEWTVALASDDVRDAALALSLAHATRDRARRALALGAVPVVLATLAIAFGLAPLVIAPVAALLATAAARAHAKI